MMKNGPSVKVRVSTALQREYPCSMDMDGLALLINSHTRSAVKHACCKLYKEGLIERLQPGVYRWKGES